MLKLNIHEFTQNDIPFLDSLGITQSDQDSPHIRFINIYSQEDFLQTRSSLLEKYTVLQEIGAKVILQAK